MQFHTCAIHDLGVVFGKEDLDEAFKGGLPDRRQDGVLVAGEEPSVRRCRDHLL